jgi:hypothetical protein
MSTIWPASSFRTDTHQSTAHYSPSINRSMFKKYYPFGLTGNSNRNIFKKIATVTSQYQTNKLIRKPDRIETYQLVLIFASSDFQLSNYDEIGLRIVAKNKIVVIIRIPPDQTADQDQRTRRNKNITINHIVGKSHQNVKNIPNSNGINLADMNGVFFSNPLMFERMLHHIVRTVKHDFTNLYNIDLRLDRTIYIGHKMSCNYLIRLNQFNRIDKNQIILLDPQIDQSTVHCLEQSVDMLSNGVMIGSSNDQNAIMKNITIILPSNRPNDPNLQKLLKSITTKVYIIPDVTADNFYNRTNGMAEHTAKTSGWDRLVGVVCDVMKDYYK